MDDERKYSHVPVLLEEVITLLKPGPGESYIDATLGGGGYTRAILDKTKPDGKVLSIDLDQEAIDNFKSEAANLKINKDSVILAHGNFAQIDRIVKNHTFSDIRGIVADIGLSSYQLDQSGRGISFQKKEPLDMRFDRSSDIKDAKLIVNDYQPAELERIFREYGEEPFSRQIVKTVLRHRNQHQIHYTTELYEIVKEALPKPVKHKATDHARRVFQALRIEVNQELQSLEEFLPKAFDLLAPGGRMAVVSFHSLEDRIVKRFFASLTKGCVCPIDFPQCVCGKDPKGKLLTKKPVTASEEELKQNSRSKPAKLRAIQKI